MTFVGKLLVVVQLVLAVCFMAFAGAVYTAETNWKAKTDTAQKQATQAQQDLNTANQQLQQTKADLGEKINQLTQQVALLDDKVKRSTENLQRAEEELNAARTAVDRTTAVANISEEQARFRQEETLRQRERNQRLQDQINALQVKARELEDSLFGKTRQIESMTVQNDENIKQLATYRQMILSLEGSLNPEDYQDLVSTNEPPPQVTGKVIASKVTPKGVEYVEVSLGSDDGFKKNDTLEVFRGSDYVGKLKLTLVNPDRSVGQVIQRVRNGTIQKGDNVTPRI